MRGLLIFLAAAGVVAYVHQLARLATARGRAGAAGHLDPGRLEGLQLQTIGTHATGAAGVPALAAAGRRGRARLGAGRRWAFVVGRVRGN